MRAASSHLTDLRSLRRENTRERDVSLQSNGGGGGRGKRRREGRGDGTYQKERGGDEGGGAGGRWLLGFGTRRRESGYIGLEMLGFRPRQKFGLDWALSWALFPGSLGSTD